MPDLCVCVCMCIQLVSLTFITVEPKQQLYERARSHAVIIHSIQYFKHIYRRCTYDKYFVIIHLFISLISFFLFGGFHERVVDSARIHAETDHEPRSKTINQSVRPHTRIESIISIIEFNVISESRAVQQSVTPSVNTYFESRVFVCSYLCAWNRSIWVDKTETRER